MKQKFSKKSWLILGVIVLIIVGFFVWYFWKGPGKKKTTPPVAAATAPTTTTNNSSATPSTTTPAVTTPPTATTTPTASLQTFNQTGFNFTFQYPSTWNLSSATTNKSDPTQKVAQETVEITTDAGVQFRFDNPAITTDFSQYNLNNQKNITAGSLTFSRNFGNDNSNGQTLYVATYTDPNNIDALSVSFYGIGSLDDNTVSNLDNLISTFKFTQ